MKVIYNNIIPFKGYKCINILGVLFVRKNTSPMRDWNFNHEFIHTRQMRETLYVLFYVWYLVEFLVRLVKYRRWLTAYKNVCFEREAYANERDYAYLSNRKIFSFLKYIKHYAN